MKIKLATKEEITAFDNFLADEAIDFEKVFSVNGSTIYHIYGTYQECFNLAVEFGKLLKTLNIQ